MPVDKQARTNAFRGTMVVRESVPPMRIPGYAKTTAVVLCSSALCTFAVHASDMFDIFSDRIDATQLAGGAGFAVPSPCPSNMVLVRHVAAPFCIDTYEAHAADTCPYPTPRTAQETVANLTAIDCAPEAGQGSLPWTYIDREQAALACAKTGKRLATAGEWYAAALGTSSGCVVDSTGPSVGGARESCVSTAGAYDLVGNVWEWVEEEVREGEWSNRDMPRDGYVASADIDGVPLATAAMSTPRYGTSRYWGDARITAGMMRGGYFGSGRDAGMYSVYAASPPTFAGRGVGFRCVTDVLE